MKYKIMKTWVRELRSGDWAQCTGRLEKDGAYCCLGVLSAIAMTEGVCDYTPSNRSDYGEEWTSSRFGDSIWGLSPEVMEWAGIKYRYGEIADARSLAALNDTDGLTFKEIANYIEKNWREL